MKINLLLLIFLFGTLSAETDFSRPLTLPELVSYALENNPETCRSWWDAKRAAAHVGSAKSAYWPKLAAQANANHGRDFKFINGPNTQYTTFGADLILSMLLFDYGERSANVEEAKMALLASEWQSNWVLQSVMVKVLENGYAYLHAEDVLKASLLSLSEAEKVLDAAKELNRAGLTAITDVYTSQASYFQMQMEVAERKSQLDIQRGNLAVSLGLDADTCLHLVPIGNLPIIKTEQSTELIALAKQKRADLFAKQARLAESYARKQSISASYGPKVFFSGQGGAEHAAHDKSNGAQYRVALNFELPLFDGFNRMYKKQAAYANTRISEQEIMQLQLEISREVFTYSRTLEAAAEMLSFAEDNLQSALQAYEGTLDKYSAGKMHIAEVSIAQQQLNAARIRYSNNKTKFLVSQANLAYATGTLIP